MELDVVTPQDSMVGSFMRLTVLPQPVNMISKTNYKKLAIIYLSTTPRQQCQNSQVNYMYYYLTLVILLSTRICNLVSCKHSP